MSLQDSLNLKSLEGKKLDQIETTLKHNLGELKETLEQFNVQFNNIKKLDQQISLLEGQKIGEDTINTLKEAHRINREINERNLDSYMEILEVIADQIKVYIDTAPKGSEGSEGCVDYLQDFSVLDTLCSVDKDLIISEHIKAALSKMEKEVF